MYKNLKAELKKNNITALSIAKFLNVRSATIYDKINGKYRFYYDEAKKIKETFFPELPIEYLFETEETIETARKEQPHE